MPQFAYFVSRENVLNHIELYIHVDLVLHFLKIPSKTVLNGIKKNSNGTSTFWRYLEFPDGIWVDYDSIPKNSKTARGLPTSSSEAYAILREDKESKEQFYRQARTKIVGENMKKYHMERWPMFVKNYATTFTDKNKIKQYAKAHAILNFVIQEQERGESLKTS